MHNIIIIVSQAVMIAAFIQSVRTDIKSREIPNYLSMVIIAAGLVAAWAGNQTVADLVTGSLFASSLFVGGFISYKLGFLGGGDVKLWSASALAFGVQAGTFALAMASIGFVLAIIVLVLQKRAAKLGLKPVLSDEEPMPRNLMHNLGCPELPYGVAIAGAGIALSLNNISQAMGGVL